jgi:hypothetical protein
MKWLRLRREPRKFPLTRGWPKAGRRRRGQYLRE